jgi:peptidoglycan/xylan/chitin deacetylase (PgdA/CDA1 family)
MMLTDKLIGLACRVKRGGVILNYHTLSAEQMREQLELWAPYFDFIHHDELGRRLESPGAKPFCLVTFDDGKKSNLTEAAPVLTKYGVAAVFYVVTKFSDGELPALWFDTYRAFLKKVGGAPPGLETAQLKRLPLRERLERLESAYHAHGFRVQLDDDDSTALTWNDVRALKRQGHTIGAHSETHAILTTVPLAEARTEIERSMARVREEIGGPCVSFAFPNGNYTNELARYAMRQGARTVMTTDPTWTAVTDEPWRLPRVQMHPEQSASRQRFKVFAASFGCLLGNADDTGRKYVWERRKKTFEDEATNGWRVQDAAGRGAAGD